jgi:hypothetical protein
MLAAPNRMIANRRLRNMGWIFKDGRYYCPWIVLPLLKAGKEKNEKILHNYRKITIFIHKALHRRLYERSSVVCFLAVLRP